jgi:threonine/homoserine/homoserine lactone efflux protein
MSGQVASMSVIWRPLLALLFASAVVMGSPGPSTISVTASGAAYGFRRSLGYVSGLIVGTMSVLLAVALGVVAFVLSMPYGTRILTCLASSYLLYLAFKIATAPPLDSLGGDRQPPAFLGGFLFAIANPKAYLAIAAVFAGTTLVDDKIKNALVKIALLAGMIVIIHLAWLSAGVALSRVLQAPLASRLVNLTLAAILAAMAVTNFVGQI